MLPSRRLFGSTPSSLSYSRLRCPISSLTTLSLLSRPAPTTTFTASSRTTAAFAPLPASSRPVHRPRRFRFPAAVRGGCVCGVRLKCTHSLLHTPNADLLFLHLSSTASTPSFASALRPTGVISTVRRAARISGSFAFTHCTPSFLTAETARPTRTSSYSTFSSSSSSSNNSGHSKSRSMAAPVPNGGGAAASAGSPISASAVAAITSSGLDIASGGLSSGAGSRRFAPLDPAKARRLVGQENVRWVRGVVFDVDGTLCEPQNYMFAEMRAALSIPPHVDILEHIYALPPAQQPHAFNAIRNIERRAMALQTPQPGLVPLMDYLESRMLRKAICTRNFDTPVLHLLEKFLPGHSFDPIVTRDFRPPKPHPAGVLSIAKAWGCLEAPVSAGAMPPLDEGQGQGDVQTPPAMAPLTPPDAAGVGGVEAGAGAGAGAVIAGSAPSLIMVGDSLDDMVAGRRAGAATVLLLNDSNMHLARREETDLVIRRLDELIVVLENGFLGQHGT